MKKCFLFVISVLLVGCQKKTEPAADSFQKKVFKDEVRLKTTPVQSQGHSSLCWIYAMLGTIETEHLMQGDSVVLSADYVARMLLTEQVRERYLTKGKKNISMRGMMPMTVHLLEQYGVEPLASYHAKSKVNYHVVGRKLKQIADVALSRRQGLKHVDKQVNDLLDSTIDFLPKFVFMLGAEYTPLEFAHSVCQNDEYEAYTSFTHHPFNEPFVLELADNQMNDSFMNIPIDTLMSRIEGSLREGHPVCWEGDVSERGFSFKKGVGQLDSAQESSMKSAKNEAVKAFRQQQFEQFKTTDDHCMVLVGIARDENNEKYYIAKNSWGKNNLYGGFMYLSENYVKLKTIAVMIRR